MAVGTGVDSVAQALSMQTSKINSNLRIIMAKYIGQKLSGDEFYATLSP